MNIYSNIKKCLLNRWERIIIFRLKKNEIKKYKNKKRKEIYSKVKLTKEQQDEIDALYKKSYGKKIPYVWHRHYTAFNDKFNVNYFPELLYIPEFEHYMNMHKEYLSVFADKNLLPIIAQMAGVKVPKVIFSCTMGLYRDSNYQIINKKKALQLLEGEVFIKPSIDTNSGEGCMLFDIEKGVDRISGKNALDILNLYGNNFVVQERLICHEALRKIYSQSVNTFRVITYRWRDEIRSMPVILRIGQGGNYVDNAHQGGYLYQ